MPKKKTEHIVSVHMPLAVLKRLDAHVRKLAKKGLPNASRSGLLIACFKRIASRH